MCSTARCSNCHKTTWRGCGQHVEAVLAGVPATARCTCVAEQPKSVLQRFFGR